MAARKEAVPIELQQLHTDEDRKGQVIEYWEDFFEMAADEGRHDRILRDCERMPG